VGFLCVCVVGLCCVGFGVGVWVFLGCCFWLVVFGCVCVVVCVCVCGCVGVKQ